MSFPPLQPIRNAQSYVSGDVTIDPSAAIATGVLLQADPNSRIIIGAGACIGMGTILHAYQGTLEIGPGAIIGAGVLVIGECQIGANACVGSVTTILNRTIEPGQMIPSGTCLSDEVPKTPVPAPVVHPLEEVEQVVVEEQEPIPPPQPAIAAFSEEPQAPFAASETAKAGLEEDTVTQASIRSAIARNAIANPPIPLASSPSAESEPVASPSPEPTNGRNPVSGKQQLQRLMNTLFPNNPNLS